MGITTVVILAVSMRLYDFGAEHPKRGEDALKFACLRRVPEPVERIFRATGHLDILDCGNDCFMRDRLVTCINDVNHCSPRSHFHKRNQTLRSTPDRCWSWLSIGHRISSLPPRRQVHA